MKRLFYIAVLILGCKTLALAQTGAIIPDTLPNNKHSNEIALLGKFWGFLKYHHPYVTGGKTDWDKELIEALPAYMRLSKKEERNSFFEKWLAKLGPVPVFKDSALSNKDVVLKPDLSWINSKNFSPSVVESLKNLQNNHSTADQRYVKFLSEEGIVYTSLINEPSYSDKKHPTYPYRLLAAFRYWNIVSYFYPYRNLTQYDWNTYLAPLVTQALAASNEADYAHFIQRMIASVKDTHATVRSASITKALGKYRLPFLIKMIADKAVVTYTEPEVASMIHKGDILTSVNNNTIEQLVEQNALLVSASNRPTLLREVAKVLTRTRDSISQITVLNNDKLRSLSVKNVKYDFLSKPEPDYAYQRDSSYFFVRDSILYINVGTVKRTHIEAIRKKLPGIKGIIFNGRQYPSEGIQADLYTDVFFSRETPFAMFSTGIRGYPGAFKVVSPITAGKNTARTFNGSVVFIVNEETQSSGEFFAMFVKAMPNARIVGSTTAGADGNVIPTFALPGGYYTQLTGLGVFYPDGSQTQQVGIKPDINVTQTIKGYRNNQDELLDRAILALQTNR